MGNGTSRVAGWPFNGKSGVDLDLEPLDEGLGHSFCYVRPLMSDSSAITPSNSERFTVDSSTLDSKTLSGANGSTARTGNQSVMFAIDVQEPAASFESTSSFAAIPLQPVPRSSGPLNGFMSRPLERGYALGPLDKVGGFMSGPIEKGEMSGPLNTTDKSNFSAPLVHGRRRPHFQHLMRSVAGPMKRTFLKHSMRSCWMQRFFLHPVTQMALHSKEPKFLSEPSRNCFEGGPSEGEYGNSRNLQWTHGKAGEDRVHVVLSEEQGWLFIGIYDGFSGPDAPDFLMRHLYIAIDKELERLLWDYDESGIDPLKPEISNSRDPDTGLECSKEDQAISWNACHCRKSSLGVESESVPIANLSGRGRKSMRLYELLQMEPWDDQGSFSFSQMDRQGKGSCGGFHRLSDNMECITSSNYKDDSSYIRCEDPTTSGEDTGVGRDFDNQCAATVASISGQRRRGASLDHDAVLRAIARAVESTEEAYMEMVEKALYINPELALMGSCGLVMLMKDQDVYAMNLGDSRVILAQERANDRNPNPALLKDDLKHRNRSRESVVCMEMDRISEESPMDNNMCRIKAEHPDDDKAISNDRVKGQLKVTRVFGAGFLKKQRRGGCPCHMVHGKCPEGDPAQYLVAELLFRAAKRNGMDFHELLNIPHGDRRKYHDDVSVMVVSLKGRIWRYSG
ncbi:peptidyl-prolyl cis-trans isomerase CYP20-3 [Hibiscus syriacus]|uniref:Peptidyl-prolyl cis-trans isomerase CYP20-3 n=1 Tax=Hibiscus syriacus TaxID=106335 RepID=A0A6A2WGV8_HIBSY|nr:peptidyl-prolyl cis-trans isomerase CYP20-3 [Hibiscus syriacus]